MFIKYLFPTVYFLLFQESLQHGMMLDPIGRSSVWRIDSTAPVNYDDNENFCGGATVQWETFGGKCGVCGDRYDAPHPQPNENTGTYGQGKVVRVYSTGNVIDTNIKLTTNHRGNFEYSLCVLENPNAPESGEDCFLLLLLEDGSEQFDVIPEQKEFNNRVKLPEGISCARCVLRWHYTAGNTWGDCGNGTQAQGCGPQETFRSCADIAIV